ncbi:hypothetical protein E1B28_005109 [Marasmius oreades]|uniref:Uncharacterized protein n=1 Tax=Marasmius oreades TaxID=181124 RepID=A0A9P7V069_9AGAR|nr:uncharacterized protein E1B28_005109 [Marasmius oreades]KAG7097790.1 hypothetical protein E1B28_005109 [Marasmius oreades]
MTVWVDHVTNGPLPDPVAVRPLDTNPVVVATERRANQLAVPPDNFFTPVVEKADSSLTPNMAIKGPFSTTRGMYWLSSTKDPMKCPPNRSAFYPYRAGDIWINDILNDCPARQVFVWTASDDWTIVPGQALEHRKARFQHPVEADRWFSFNCSGIPTWLKMSTIEKNGRALRKWEALGGVDEIEGAQKRARLAMGVGKKPKRAGTPHPTASGTARVLRPAVAHHRTPTEVGARRVRIRAPGEEVPE